MGYIYNNELKRLGRIDSDGYIYTEALERVGRIHADGYIYTEGLKRIGRIQSDGYIFSENLERLGKVDKDGYIYNNRLECIGRLDRDIVNRIYGITGISHTNTTNTHSRTNSSDTDYKGYRTKGGYELERNGHISALIGIPLGVTIGMAVHSFLVGLISILLIEEIMLAILDTSWAKNNHRSVFSIAGGHYFFSIVLLLAFLYFIGNV